LKDFLAAAAAGRARAGAV